MLQAAESILGSIRGALPLPRLLPSEAKVADAAAQRIFERIADSLPEGDDGETAGGTIFLVWMTSFMVAQYGREAVASMALTTEQEQRTVRDNYTQEQIKGMLDDD